MATLRKSWFLFYFTIFLYLNPAICSNVIILDEGNFDTVIAENKAVFINFYADWCRFSQMLSPVFDQTSDIAKEEFPTGLVLAKLDCDKHPEIGQRYQISKYPTLKLWRNGQPTRREYRGKRSVDAFSNWLRNQMKSSVKEFHALSDIGLDPKKRSLVAYFESKDGDNYKTFEKLAEEFRDDCEFHVGVGDASAKERKVGDNIVFQPENNGVATVYTGGITDFEHLKLWTSDKCIPLVREITFENAEELTEEGKPFLLMFYDPNNKGNIEEFKHEVSVQLVGEKATMNFLTADGHKFSHPLHHLGKSQSDLPIVAIDSFRHMYLLPKFDDIRIPGRLKKFVDDLHSGKLHREFHHGPDPNADAGAPQVEGGKTNGDAGDAATEHQPDGGDAAQQPQDGDKKAKTSPPETVFKKLSPSYNRYTLLKDEL